MDRNRDSACLATADVMLSARPRARRVVRAPCTPLDPAPLLTIRELLEEHTLQGLSRLLDLPPSSIASAAAGASIRQASRVLLEQRLAALANVSSRRGAR